MLSATLATACGRDNGSDGNTDGAGGDSGGGTRAEQLDFAPSSTLTLAPGERTELGVVVAPSGSFRVDFDLVSEDPSSIVDAFLDTSAVTTDARGEGSVLLTAPTKPTAFVVRASTNDLEARRTVSVSDLGFGAIRVTPQYSGKRQLDAFVASARIGTLCEKIADPLVDGALTSGPDDTLPLRVESIPVGPRVAVSVRAGRLAAGCLNIPSLENDEERTLVVSLADLPMKIDDGTFELHFGIESSTTEFSTHLVAARNTALAAFTGGTTSDPVLLLDTIGSLIDGDDADSFAAARTSAGYDSITLTGFGNATLLRTRVGTWLDDAALSIIGPDTFTGRLTFNPTNALFVLESAAGVPGAVSGFFVGSTWTRSIGSGDQLVLGGALEYGAPEWLVGIAERKAFEAGSATPSAQLVELADCASLADAWTTANAGELYESCDAECAELLCQDALDELWDRSRSESTPTSSIAVAMSSAVNLREDATIDTFRGTWIGTVKPSGGSVGGSADGENVDD